ncbi:MAG: Transcriptional regulator, AsnC family, partial [uncultured Blastococcus sp.]
GPRLHPHPDRGRQGRPGRIDHQRDRRCQQGRGCHRPLRRHRPGRGGDRGRPRPPRRGPRPVGRRDHPHADLPGRQHL